MFSLIKRPFITKSPEVLLGLYKTAVRLHIEFCVSACSPHSAPQIRLWLTIVRVYKKKKKLIEKVQHRFTRMIPGL